MAARLELAQTAGCVGGCKLPFFERELPAADATPAEAARGMALITKLVG